MPNQKYLGYCVLSLKRRDCGDLAKLHEDEQTDFFLLVRKLEDAFRQAFGATMFNWSCLMNLAYRNDPPNPHVHWHCRPRYTHTVQFAGTEFADDEFGSHYELKPAREVDVTTRQLIVEEIKKHL